MDMRYAASVGALKVLGGSGYLDMGQDDLDFLMAPRPWMATDRNRARRCIEMYAYGCLDVIGLPRFPLPAEFLACVIARCVHAVNWQTSCVVMSVAEWSENVILRVDAPVSAEVLFSHVLRLAGGLMEVVDHVEAKVRSRQSASGQGAVQA